jgi:hypothetical protein
MPRRPGGQDTAEGDYRIGVCILGHIAYLGQQYDASRVQTCSARKGEYRLLGHSPTLAPREVHWSIEASRDTRT